MSCIATTEFEYVYLLYQVKVITEEENTTGIILSTVGGV